MTYKELLKNLSRIPEDRLNDNALVFIQWDNEYLPISAIWESGEENDVLDEGHTYLVIKWKGFIMSRNTLTLVQEVYFDLCDLLDNNELSESIEGLFEFDDMREFITEQRRKLALIERDLDFNDDCPKFEPAREEI